MCTGSSNRSETRRCEAGSSIIEVLVSLALVVIGLLGVYSAYTSSVSATAHGQRVTQATARAERQLEMLRNAPTTAIRCLAGCASDTACSTGCAASCTQQCCQGLGDGGVSCMPAVDGGAAATVCVLTPGAETDNAQIEYTYCDPVVHPDVALPFLYDVKVKVTYSTGEVMAGTATRTVVLHSNLYKP
ncbi:MAG TPA: hypothetical protein VGQ83_23205 [Polyangia bacterium]|jgi:type II secretory pathway pseudopilin PulG